MINALENNKKLIWQTTGCHMGNEVSGADKSFRRALLVPTLIFCVFLVWTVYVFLSTLLVNISSSFNVSIGTASQLIMVGTLTGLIVGLALSAVSIRFKHRSLLLFGLSIFAIGALGFFFSWNFAAAVFSEVLVGIGASMISVMVYTLIGEQLPLERRGWAVGLAMSGVMTAFVIVAVLSGAIAGIAGWRMVLLWLIFPLSLACLILVLVIVPSNQPQPQSADNPSLMQAFKKILLNRSPMACMLSTALTACIAVVPVYAVSFYRLAYAVSPATGGAFSSIVAVGGIFGAALGGRMVNRIGRKTLAATAVFISGVSAILFTFIPNEWISLAIWGVSAFTIAMTWAGLPSLNLEQVPEYRGSMMAIASSFDNSGTVLGVIIGGLVLNLYANNFHFVMVIIGALGASAAAVLLFFAKDPCKRNPI